jgi:hypothetical protein
MLAVFLFLFFHATRCHPSLLQKKKTKKFSLRFESRVVEEIPLIMRNGTGARHFSLMK